MIKMINCNKLKKYIKTNKNNNNKKYKNSNKK